LPTNSNQKTEQELEQYLADKFGKVAPIAKSAGIIIPEQQVHEIPDFKQNNAAIVSSDNNKKIIELLDMFDNGGAS
jgi:hypothetical protein